MTEVNEKETHIAVCDDGVSLPSNFALNFPRSQPRNALSVLE